MNSIFYSGFALAIMLGWFFVFSDTLENYKKLSMFGKKLFLRIFFIALIISIVFLIFAISPFSVHTSQFDNINFLLSSGIVALIAYCVLGTGRLDD